MQRKNRLSWKLSVVVLIIVTLVILGAGWAGSLLSRQYALDAARDVLQFNSESIRNAIDELMLSRHSSGSMDFIGEVSRRNPTYQDLALVSHPSGRIATSRIQKPGTYLQKGNHSCTLCHVDANQKPVSARSKDAVISSPDRGRVLQVVTPVFTRPDCHTSECHSRIDSGTMIGFLRADYSLVEFDETMTRLDMFLSLAALLAIILAITAMLIMFRVFLAKPLRTLHAGIDTLAHGDFDYRFTSLKDDEIGLVGESFNNMAGQLQRHQKELRRALEYLESIVENSGDLIISVNTDGLIQTFNRGAEQALGYERDEVIGRRIEMLFHDPDERATAIARLREQDKVSNWETSFITRDGEICHVLLTLSYLRDRRGNLLGTLGISKDITREKDFQRKLIRSEQEAAIGQAVTGIQHAVKNMLNTLRGGLYIVRVGQKKSEPNRILEGCDMIEEGLERISALSMNMLKYAREWKIEPEAVDLAQMVEKVKMAVSQTATERDITIRSEMADSLPLVSCDPHLIHMGIMDIVSNAMDACELKEYAEPETPELIIRATLVEGNGAVAIEIEDNGAGMTQEVRKNVFTPFFSTKKKWGTGLGLALTSRITELHGGQIEVESEPGRGTVFRITLPLKGQRTDSEEKR